MTKLSERMLRDLHVGIGDIVLSDIINEASALEARIEALKDDIEGHEEAERALIKRIEALEKERDADWRKFVHLRDDNERIRVLGEELAEKAARIEALESKLGSAMQALVQAGLREQVAELDRKHIEELERELAKLQPPSTLDRMIDEGHIDDSPNDY